MGIIKKANKSKNKYGRHSITQHWIRNSLGVVIVILLIVEVMLVLIVRNYYYSSARQYVTSRMNIVTGAVMNYGDDASVNYNSEIRSLVESYEDKDRIELMAIKSDGSVDITSSGFSPSQGTDMTDYENAKTDPSGIASQIFRLPTGEKVVAVTAVISPRGSELSLIHI